MFARNVSVQVKLGSLPAFTETYRKEIVPLLRRAKGFQDEITFAFAGGTEVVTTTLWDSRASSDAHHRDVYPQILNILARVSEGIPTLRISEVVSSTFPKFSMLLHA